MVSGAASFADTGQIGPKESGAQMLEWRGSDGSASRRPAGVSYVENKDRDGNVNYYRAVRDTEEASVSWRCEIGTYIAEALGLPSGKVYWMKGWPSGYGFYDHQKGQLPNPRHDLYLCGSPTTVRFRSKNEFKPHAKWLMTDPTLNPRNCGCKYCTKTKSQVEVNQVQGLSGLQRPPEHHLRGTHSTPGETMTHARRKIIREKMKEEKAKSTKRSDLPLTALPERLRDLNSDRMFRPFELVWVALQEPISIDESRSIAIEFWPAIILSYVTKNEPTPHKPGDTNYNIISRYSFTIRLLGVNHQVSVPEERLLPQLGYVPNDDLLSAVKDCEPSRPLDPQFTEYARFNPLPEFDSTIPIAPGSYTKEDALPAYCLALHIVACLTPVWSATHSYSSDDKGVQSDDLFQGLWWGSERIWLDDLVRLRPSRDELDPENSLGLLHPSSPDASTRPLLLRLTYIVVDQEDPSGMSICVGGDLYELAEAETKHQPAGPQSGQPTRQSIFGPPTGLLGPSDLVPAPVAGTSSSSGAKTGPALAESPIAMPPPPPGFIFRKLLSQGSEMIVDVGAIAGRYYPKLLQDDTLNLVRRTVKQDTNVRPGESIVGTVDGYTRERVRRAQNSPESGAIDELTPLLALVGLYLGEGNVMQPEQWAKGRMQTIRGSETNGRRVLYEQWTKLASGSSDVEMVDP